MDSESKVILSINAGSSSVKVSVYSIEHGQKPKQLAEVEVSGLSSPPAKIKYSCHGKQKFKGDELKSDEDVQSQDDAFQYILKTLIEDQDLKEVASKDGITLAAHRVVHGGDYSAPQPIGKETLHNLEELTDLAPLHNASALNIIRACIKELPKAKNIAVFDSQFHQTIPECVRTIPIDQNIAKKNKLRKYVCASLLHERALIALGIPWNQLCFHTQRGCSLVAKIRGGNIHYSLTSWLWCFWVRD